MLVTREGSRTIIVGDVHGCLDELKSLLQACGFDASTDHVVLVGDLVNKGPHSAETVAYARESGFACVRGNHDDAALFAHEARSEAGARGSDSKYSELKYAWVDALGEADLAFLQELPHTLRLAREEVLVVHAGVVPGVPLAEQRAEDMTTMRNLVRADGGGWWAAASASAGVAWAEEWRPEPTVVAGVRHVVFGHDAKRRLQRHEHATGLAFRAHTRSVCVHRQLLKAIARKTTEEMHPSCRHRRRLDVAEIGDQALTGHTSLL